MGTRIQTSIGRLDPFEKLFEEINERLLKSQAVDLEAVCQQYPQHADRLRQLFPAMSAMVDLGQSNSDPNSPSGIDNGTSSSEPLMRTLGDFRIVREVGRGGMGVVYEAEQISLGRRVALKVLPFVAMLDKGHLHRFQNEAKAAAGLHHSHIVPIYSVGSERGVHYFAMQFIEGQTVSEWIGQLQQTNAYSAFRGAATTPQAWLEVNSEHDGEHADSESSMVPPSETVRQAQAMVSTNHSTDDPSFYRMIARLGVQIAGALEHAHFHGVVHRDIKPANLLLDCEGNVWVTDFGVARLESDTGMTMTGDLVGTIRYMSPEQALANRVEVDHRTDIYSLGISLYELATLRSPFDGQNRHELIRQIAFEEPVVPRKLNSRIPRDLETIILKATSKDANDRYATAQHLANDLSSFLRDQPIQAKRPNLLVRTAKWSRRHRGIVASVAATLIMSMIVGLLLVSRAYDGERKQRIAAESERVRAEASLRFAQVAVDDMYDNLASDWFSQDGAISNLQTDFLQKAVRFYERLANESLHDASRRQSAVDAYSRIGEISFRLHNYEQAIRSLNKAIELGDKLLAESPEDVNQHIAMVWRHGILADAALALADIDTAREAYTSAFAHVRALQEFDPTSNEYREILARYQIGLAGSQVQQDQFDNAELMVRQAIETLDGLPKNVRDSLAIRITRMAGRHALIDILRLQGKLNEAHALCSSALAVCRSVRNLMFHDSKHFLAYEARLTEQLGRIAFATDKPAKAEQLFREALQLRTDGLSGRRDPILFFVESAFKQELNFEKHFQLVPFCEYVEIQLELARVLMKLGKPYAAEEVLGECTRTTQMLCDTRPDVLRFRVARANSWALASRLLGQRRPHESQLALDWASTVWRDTQRTFEFAPAYRSGVNGQLNDLDWFEREFPDARNRSDTLEFENENAAVRETVFVQRALGLSWFRADFWEQAIIAFGKAAELGHPNEPYDLLHVAMAHQEMGNLEEARKVLGTAKKTYRELR